MKINNRGVTGIELVALSFLGSLLATFFVGAWAGWEARKLTNKLGLTHYNQIQEAIGRLDIPA